MSRYSGIALIPVMAGSLRRTEKYASFLMIACKQVSQTARALHPGIFEQPDWGNRAAGRELQVLQAASRACISAMVAA